MHACSPPYRHRGQRKWVSRIKLNNKSQHLGYFSDEEEAARKFDEFAFAAGRATNFARDDDSLITVAETTPRSNLHIASSSSSSSSSSCGSVETRNLMDSCSPVAANNKEEYKSNVPTLREDDSSAMRPAAGKMRSSSSTYNGVHFNKRDVSGNVDFPLYIPYASSSVHYRLIAHYFSFPSTEYSACVGLTHSKGRCPETSREL